jgi:hypothetical protein
MGCGLGGHRAGQEPGEPAQAAMTEHEQLGIAGGVDQDPAG